LVVEMTAGYETMDLNDDEDDLLLSSFGLGTSLSSLGMSAPPPSVFGSPSSKPNRRPASLQVLSPRARAANASKTSPQPLPTSQGSLRDKGKGRARPADIIELSDSDDEGDIIASTIKKSLAVSKPKRTITLPNDINQPLSPGPLGDAAESNVVVTVAGAKVISRNLPAAPTPTVPGNTEGTPQGETPVPGPSRFNQLDRLIASVLEIVPDVDPDHVMALFTATHPGGEPEQAARLLETILHHLLENGNYPKKQVEGKRKRQEEPGASLPGPSALKKRKTETVIKINVASTDRPHFFAREYYEHSMVCRSSFNQQCPHLALSTGFA